MNFGSRASCLEMEARAWPGDSDRIDQDLRSQRVKKEWKEDKLRNSRVRAARSEGVPEHLRASPGGCGDMPARRKDPSKSPRRAREISPLSRPGRRVQGKSNATCAVSEFVSEEGLSADSGQHPDSRLKSFLLRWPKPGRRVPWVCLTPIPRSRDLGEVIARGLKAQRCLGDRLIRAGLVAGFLRMACAVCHGSSVTNITFRCRTHELHWFCHIVGCRQPAYMVISRPNRLWTPDLLTDGGRRRVSELDVRYCFLRQTT
jgi:hypothetical protein